MQFDFDKLIERRGTHCVKWDKPMADDVIPMWVADMDFEVAPAITDALRKRVEHGVFGYVAVPDEFFQATTGWFDRRHQWHINHDWIQYTIGVVPALAVIVRALTSPGDKVMIMTPVYNCFFSAVQNNDRQLVECPLIYEDATYRIDFDEMERKMCNGEVKLLILCKRYGAEKRGLYPPWQYLVPDSPACLSAGLCQRRCALQCHRHEACRQPRELHAYRDSDQRKRRLLSQNSNIN